jgi:hypothetical protein
MTAEEQDGERLRAWDRYKAAQHSFLAHKAKLQQLEKPLRVLLEKLRSHLFDVTESDFTEIPKKEDFGERVAELRAAMTELECAREEARRWGFPIDKDDLTYSPRT